MKNTGKLIDLTGQRFGRLTVIERDKTTNKTYGTFWICRCDCGNIKSIASLSLRNGSTQSCGCFNKEIISQPKDLSDMIGKKFGKLTVVKREPDHITAGGQKKIRWLCVCDCGNTKVVSSQDLKKGHTKSCGCLPKKPRGSGLIDLVGERFGKLVVVERAGDYKYNSGGKTTTSPQWLCKCDCGNMVIVQGGNLRSGNTTNCGCENRASKSEIVIAKFLTANKIKYLREYSFENLKNKSGNLLRFDFAIFDDNNNLLMLLEYQGAQHYIECGDFGLYQRKYSDKMKQDFCKTNSIKLYKIKYDENLEDALKILLKEIKYCKTNK